MATETQLLLQDSYQRQLALSQRHEQRQRELKELQRAIKKPSLLGYGVLLYLAISLDLIDFIEFTGVGIIVSKIIQIFATILFIGISYIVNGKIKRARNAGERLAASVTVAMEKVSQYRTSYARVLKTARNIKVLRKPIRKAALAINKSVRVVSRNPLIKSVIANAIEFVPVVAVFFPGQIIETLWMYHDHRATYREALQIYEQAREAFAIEEQEYVALQEVELQEIAQLQELVAQETIGQQPYPYAA